MSTRAVQITELLTGLTHPTTGAILDNHTAFFYAAGTSTPKNVWTEKEQTNAYVEVDLGAIGQTQLYAEGDYKIVIEVAASGDDGDIIYTWDNLRFEHPNYYVRAITSNHTQVSNDDFLLCNTTSGQITISGLAAASWKHPLKIMRTSGANNIVFDPNGSEQIDGSSTLTISSDAIVEIVSNGSTLYSAGIRSSFVDSDGDTQIQVEESADEDTIRMDVGGVEKVVIDSADFIIENNNDVDGQEILELYSPSLTTGRSTELKIGVEDANYDCGVISFEYSGNGSTSNSIRLGVENALDTLIINGNGKVGINGGPTSADLYVNGDVDVNGDISSDNLSLDASTSGDPILEIQNQNDDANGPELRILKISSTPADNDQLFRISSYGKDSGATTSLFAYMDILALDVTDTNEAGGYKFTARVGGTYRNLLELKGYNGSVNEGEIIVNEDGQDVDFRIEASGAANAFKVQGSDGAVSISETLDIGSSTTKRVAPTGTFANNADGGPYVSGTAINISSVLTESTWESIGPTGSGADNIWTALDNVPTDADWIIIRAIISGDNGAASTDLFNQLFVRENGSSVAAGNSTWVGIASAYSDGSGNAYATTIANGIIIPVSSRIFDAYWTGNFTVDDINCYLMGWGFNP